MDLVVVYDISDDGKLTAVLPLVYHHLIYRKQLLDPFRGHKQQVACQV